MSISAMKQALEALELGCTDSDGDEVNLVTPVITSLRQAIAEAEKQEPVAWYVRFDSGRTDLLAMPITENRRAMWESAGKRFTVTPLYTAPVHASDISQERVDETAKCVHEFECPRCGHCCQQREWVGQPDLARVGEVGVWGEEKNT